MTKNEAKIFGKVLIEIGEMINKNPDMLVEILSKMAVNESVTNNISEEAAKFNLMKFKNVDNNDLKLTLERFNLTELREIIKNNNVGSIKSKSVNRLIEHILENRQKNTDSVFLNYTIDNDK